MMKAIDEAVRHGAHLGLRRLRSGESGVMASLLGRPSAAGDRRVHLRHGRLSGRRRRRRASARSTLLRAGRRRRPIIPTRSTSCRPRIPNARPCRSSALGSAIRLDAASCHVYPSTDIIGGAFQQLGAAWIADDWRVSGLTQSSSGLIALPHAPAAASSMAARRPTRASCAASAI